MTSLRSGRKLIEPGLKYPWFASPIGRGFSGPSMSASSAAACAVTIFRGRVDCSDASASRPSGLSELCGGNECRRGEGGREGGRDGGCGRIVHCGGIIAPIGGCSGRFMGVGGVGIAGVDGPAIGGCGGGAEAWPEIMPAAAARKAGLDVEMDSRTVCWAISGVGLCRRTSVLSICLTLLASASAFWLRRRPRMLVS